MSLMKKLLFIFIVTILTAPLVAKPRLIILADMGNEADEMQQMIHLMVCNNEFEIEGLIAVTGIHLRPGHPYGDYRSVTHPELFIEIIDAYAKVYDNLKIHADGWHHPDTLKKKVAAGQKGYGMGDVGKGKSSPGSELILKALTKDDDRPVWIVANGGSNTLAQAIFDYKETHTKEEVDAFIAKIKVFENGSQDNAGAWICSQYPKIQWLRSNNQTYGYGGPGTKEEGLGPNYWQPYENSEEGQLEWQKEHIMNGHGDLGKIYPVRILHDPGNVRLCYHEGGGTTGWMGLVNKGLYDIDHPSWGGWAGRFSAEKVTNYWSRHKSIRPDEEKVAPFYVHRGVSDHWVDPQDGKVYNSVYASLYRWREGMYNDEIARFDWCVKSYEEANHHPVAAFNGDRSDTIFRLKAKIEDVISVDASASSDPDADELIYKWWIYEEAGTYPGGVKIDSADQSKAQVTIPSGASGKQIHLILEIKDKNPIVSLFDYRRIVIDVE